MTIQDLNDLMANPAKVGSCHFTDLRQLLQEYPYVSSFRLLLQKGLSNTHDIIADTELHRTTLFAPCRNQLMLLLMQCRDDEVKQENPVAEAVAPKSSLKDKVNHEDTEADDDTVPNTMRYAAEVDAFLSHFENQKAKRKEQDDDEDEAPLRLRSTNRQIEDEDSNDEDIQNTPSKSNGFFTETLAKVYIKQEKFQKAIDIFEQLVVKVPEKSEYYSEQIRFLKKLIKYS